MPLHSWRYPSHLLPLPPCYATSLWRALGVAQHCVPLLMRAARNLPTHPLQPCGITTLRACADLCGI